MEFTPFPKIARLSRDMVVTEKIDGTNALVSISPFAPWDFEDPKVIDVSSGLSMRAGSRTRWITPDDDNFDFARWVRHNSGDLFALGEGQHHGEWWGRGIQRGYGLAEKRFSLFNVGRWYDPRDCAGEDLEGRAAAPECCRVVPILARGPMSTMVVEACVQLLRQNGSCVAPGFMDPEGVVVWHEAARQLFKKTLERDEAPKTAFAEAA